MRRCFFCPVLARIYGKNFLGVDITIIIIIIPLYQLAVKLNRGKHVCSIETEVLYELLRATKFPMSLPLHINLSD
jgi:hypothetical protein